MISLMGEVRAILDKLVQSGAVSRMDADRLTPAFTLVAAEFAFGLTDGDLSAIGGADPISDAEFDADGPPAPGNGQCGPFSQQGDRGWTFQRPGAQLAP